MRSLRCASFFVAAAALSACQSTNNQPDVTYEDTTRPSDVTSNDGDGGNVSPDADGSVATDAGDTGGMVGDATDTVVVPDGSDVTVPDGITPDAGPGADPCASGALIDLATAGSRSGATTTYTGSSASTPAAGVIAGECASTVTHEVALRYVPATTSYLRISTVNAGTPTTFDTVAWLLNACSPTGTFEGCNNDVSPTDRRSTFTTAATAAMGTPVFIFVAGFSPTRTGFTDSGAFQLTVTEVPLGTVGGACDPMGVTSVCPSSSHCLSDSGSPICVADGSMGGRCLMTLPACNSGLGCNGDRLSTTTRCVPEIPAGGTCDPTMRTNVCATGLSCISGTCM
jgi:hypothetical protein